MVVRGGVCGSRGRFVVGLMIEAGRLEIDTVVSVCRDDVVVFLSMLYKSNCDTILLRLKCRLQIEFQTNS